MANSNPQPTTNVATNNTPIPSATQVGGADIGFLNGSQYNNTGMQIQPPTSVLPAQTPPVQQPTAVFSSSQAADQAKLDQAKLVATQTAYSAGKTPIADAAKTSTATVATNNIPNDTAALTKDISAELVNNPIYKGLTSMVDKSIADLDANLDSTNKLLDAQISKLDTNQQNTAAAIKASAIRRRDEMTRLNQSVLNSATQAGIMAGRNRYTPETENVALKQIEVEGLQRLTDLDAKEQADIAEAQNASDEKKFSLLNAKLAVLKDTQKEKQATLNTLYTNSIALEQDAYARAKDKAAAEIVRQKEFNDFAKEHDLYKSFYTYDGGGEVYDSATGTKITNEQYKALSVLGDESDIQILSKAQDKAKDNTYVGKIGEYTDEQGAKHDIMGTYNYLTGVATPFNPNVQNVRGGDVIEAAPKVQMYLSAVDRLQGKLTDKDFFALKKNVSNAIQNGDLATAKTLIQQNTLDSMPAATRTAYINGDVALATISKIKSDLQRFQQMGGDTGILSSTREEIMRKLGRTSNPELLKIGIGISDLFFRLRNEMTGAAFSPAESADYAQLLPELKNQYGVNITLADAYQSLLETKREAQLRSQLGSQFYDGIFGTIAAKDNIRNALSSNPELATQIDNMHADNYSDDEIWQIIEDSVKAGPRLNPGNLKGLDMVDGGSGNLNSLNVNGGNTTKYNDLNSALNSTSSTRQPNFYDRSYPPQYNAELLSLRSDPKLSPGNLRVMRTDRHFNPAAFTTDIAKLAGLKLGEDYTVGDSFSGGRYHTANLLGDPIDTTIKVIDKIGFNTQSGKTRWTYTNSIPNANNRDWKNLGYDQKKKIIAQMYSHEGGSKLKNLFI